MFLFAAGSEGDDSEREDVSEGEVDDEVEEEEGEEEEEEEEEGEGGDGEEEGAGMEMLVSGKAVTEEGFSGVAAAAEQFQPKGITLATTEVSSIMNMCVYSTHCTTHCATHCATFHSLSPPPPPSLSR